MLLFEREVSGGLVSLKQGNVEEGSAPRRRADLMKGRSFAGLQQLDSARYYIERIRQEDDLDAMLEYNLMSSRLCRQEGDFVRLWHIMSSTPCMSIR